MLRCKWLLVSIHILLLMTTTIGPIYAEHIPENLEDMEPMVWYDLKHRGPYLRDIVCDPAVPGRMLSGFGELYESTDYGLTWNLLTKETADQELTYIFDGENIRIVSTPGSTYRIAYSDDLGNTWTAFTPEKEFRSFSVSPFSGKIVAAEMIGPTSRIAYWLSDDYGSTWTKTIEFDQIKWNSDSVFFYHSPFESGLLLAINGPSVSSSPTKVRISYDDGATWNLLPTNEGFGFRWASFHPTNPKEFYLNFSKWQWKRYPILRTRDGGQTWEGFGPDCSQAKKMGEAVYADPVDPDFFVITNHYREGLFSIDMGAIYVTRDGGATWETAFNDSADQGGDTWGHQSQVWKSPWNNDVYARLGQLYQLKYQEELWLPVYPAPANSYDDTITMGGYIDDSQQTMLYSQAYCGLFYSHDGGQTWVPSKLRISTYEKFFIRDFCCDAVNKEMIYFSCSTSDYGNNDIYISRDNGITWTEIPYSGPGELYALKTSTSIPNRLFGFYKISQEEEKVVVSDDNGETWISIDTPHPAGVGSFTDSRWDSDTWLCTECVKIQGTDFHELWLVESTDSGENWIKKSIIRILDGLTLYQDPNNIGRIYLSQSNIGLFRSDNFGETWYCFNGSTHHRTLGCLKTYGSNTIFWGKDKTTDGGRTWADSSSQYQISPRFYMPGHYVLIEGFTFLFENEHSRVIKYESSNPVVSLAGFGTTCISQGVPGYLDFLVWATDPDQNDHVTSIEIFWDDEPISYKIEQEIIDDSGFFWIQIPYDVLDDNLDKLQFRAKDIWGHLSKESMFSELF